MELDLNNNNLEGTISRSVGNLRNLQFFQVQANRMVGTIPVEMAQLDELIIFNTDVNGFTGSMPEGLCLNRDISGGKLRSLTADCLNPAAPGYLACVTPTCCTACF